MQLVELFERLAVLGRGAGDHVRGQRRRWRCLGVRRQRDRRSDQAGGGEIVECLLGRFGRADELYIQGNLNRRKLSDVLDLMVKNGKLKNYGVSVERVEEALKAIEYPGVKTVQIIFNMFRQRPADRFLAVGEFRPPATPDPLLPGLPTACGIAVRRRLSIPPRTITTPPRSCRNRGMIGVEVRNPATASNSATSGSRSA